MNSVIPSSLFQYLSPPGKSLADRAIERMKSSKDPYHDWTHPERMLKDFEFLLKEEPALKELINPEVVILSICWHDTWKAGRLAQNLIQFTYHQLLDGYGSAVLFREHSQKTDLNQHVMDQVFYAIRKHAQFQLFSVKTKEAEILRDLDDLELLSDERWHRGKHIFALAARWRAQVFRKALPLQQLSTSWAAAQKKQRLPSFLKILDDHLRELR